MKKVFFASLAILAAISFSSCKQDYIAKAKKIIAAAEHQAEAILRDTTLTPEQVEEKFDSMKNKFSLDSRILANKVFRKHPSDSVTVYFLQFCNEEGIMNKKELSPILEGLNPELLEGNRDLQRLKRDCNRFRETEIGKPFVDFYGFSSENKTKIPLSSFGAGKGKYVLVAMGASWCIPCAEEIPYLKEAYDKFTDKGLVIVSVFTRDEFPNAMEDVRNLGITWNVMVCDHTDPEFATKDMDMYPIYFYGEEAVPFIFLIGPDGTILERNLRGSSICSIIEKYL